MKCPPDGPSETAFERAGCRVLDGVTAEFDPNARGSLSGAVMEANSVYMAFGKRAYDQGILRRLPFDLVGLIGRAPG